MGIGVLGPLRVEGDDGLPCPLTPRDRVVLAALAVRVGRPLTAEQLAQALWTDDPPPTWSKSLQGCVVRLRKALGPAAIETVDHGYRLAVPPGDVDAHEFARLVGRAHELLDAGEPDRAAYVVGQALALWRGPPLRELEDWEQGRAEADRLEELHRDAEELGVDAALRCGRLGEVLADARRLVEQAPLRERRWELLALAQYRAGQQADALRTLQHLRRVLVSELGLDPGPQALALEQAILRQEPALLLPPSADGPAPACPYRGLVPYDVRDAEAFFGRDAELAACRRRLAESGLLTVVGPSGSGKSSLVRAGVAASLRRDGERVVVLEPGRHPMAALTVVPTTGRPPVVVVDQAEEAVTLCDDPRESADFFAELTALAARGRLVVALRADRFGDLAAHAPFARLVEDGLFLLTPMSAESLRAAIEGPARQAGLRLEPGLVDLLVTEVEGRPGALPHLSHVLRQTWERREGGVLTLDGYRATGGIRHAVTATAERVHDQLSAEQRPVLRDVLLRLVSPGPDGAPVRSRVPRRLLAQDAEHAEVMERLVAARLVTSDDDVVELAHEAVARAWPRLQGWLDEDAEGLRMLRHLSVAADTWEALGRPEDELYRGGRLARAVEWRERSRPDLTAVEAAYLEAGVARARREEESAREQAHQQRRVNRRLRTLLAGAALLLVATLVAGGLAVTQANRAAEATRTADARRVAAQAQLAGRVDRALALAAATAAIDPGVDSRFGLASALARIPQLTGVRRTPGVWLAVNPADATVATLALDHKVRLLEPGSYRQVAEYDPYPDRRVDGIGGNLAPLAYAADGSVLAMALLTVDDGVVRLLDASTLRPLPEQPGGQPRGAHPADVELSRDGRYLAVPLVQVPDSGPLRHLLYVWDLARAARPLVRAPLPSDTFHVEFSPDGSRIHAAPELNSDARPGRWTYATRTGRLLRAGRDGGHSLASTPDGTVLGYSRGSTVVLAAEATGRVLHRLDDPQQTVARVVFSHDNRLVGAVSDEPAAWVWEVSTGRLVERIPLEGRAASLGFHRAGGGRLLVPAEGRLHVLDLTGRDRYVPRLREADSRFVMPGSQVRYVSPYGANAVAVSTYDAASGVSELTVEDRGGGRPDSTLGLAWVGDRPDAHAWSPDNRYLAWLDADDVLRVADWASGREVARRGLPGGGQLAYTRDGERLFVAVPDGLALLDAVTLRELTGPVPVEDRVTMAEPVPGRHAAVLVTAQATDATVDAFTAADRWSLVDLRTGRTLRSGRLRAPATSMTVAPDGERMAVASANGMELVDLRTGRSRLPAEAEGTAESEGQLVTFSPDGALLASGDSAGRVSLRDGRTGALLGTVHAGDGRSGPVFLDAHRLLLQHFDGEQYVWDTSDDWARFTACRIVGRGLTRAEWRAVFGDRPYLDVCPAQVVTRLGSVR